MARDGTDDLLLSGDWMVMGSTNVNAMRYLWDDQILEVEFLSGSYYQYFQVPPEVAKAFAQTDSPGRFVWNHLRGKYPYHLLAGLSKKVPRSAIKPNVIRLVNPAR